MDKFKWRLKNTRKDETLDLGKSVFNVGRNVKADLISLDSVLSRNHATLYVLVDGLLYIQDNKSINGTFVNNQKIPPMETRQLNHGDIIGFGICEQLCAEVNPEDPLIFKVIRYNDSGLEKTNSENEAEQEQQISTNVEPNVDTNIERFSSDANDCIIISDEEEDDDGFSNSQIFKFSEKIKREPITVDENVDPYLHIKHELQDLDYCDNIPNVVDITSDQENFESTNELLDILESSVHEESVNNTIVDKERNNNISSKVKYVKPPIIKPHIQCEVKPKVDKSKGTTKKLAIKTEPKKKPCKRKNSNTIKSPEIKKPKTGTTFNDSHSDKKSIANEFKIRNKGKCSKSFKKDIDEKSKTQILSERKIKLKQITEKDSNNSCQNSNLKAGKATTRIKTSSGRGSFLLEGTAKSSATKNIEANIDSVASVSRRSSVKIANNRGSNKELTESRIQDTTISSNCSPTSDANKCDIPNTSSVSSTVAAKSTDCQRPDSTFNDDRSGLIWNNTPSRSRYPLNKLHKNINMDDEICKIVHWSVKWLMEQRNCDMSPPVNGEKEVKMPISFNSFTQYSNIMSPLVMLELWQYLYQTFYIKDEQRTPIRAFLNHKRNVGKLMYLDCECYISEEDVINNNVFRRDDFALIEVRLKDAKNCYLYNSFSYISFCKKIILQDDMYINKQIAKLSPDIPHTHLTFSLVTRNLPDKEIVGEQLIVKTIGNIGSSMRLLKAIKYLETSPICKQILRPTIEDYKISVEDTNLIVEVKLNEQQKETVLEACSLCLKNGPGLYLIKGPPGTGKSTVIMNIVLQILFSSANNSRKRTLILLTAPSNAAVDSLILKLAEIRTKLTDAHRKILKLVRIGPDSSISEKVNKFKLSSLARNYILKDKGFTTLADYKKALENDEDMATFLKRKLGHNYSYEMRSAEDVLLTRSNVICTTLNSSVTSRIMEFTKRDHLRFSCCIVDEAAQCTEAEALLPLQLGVDKFILVGDPQQLPAVVCNRDALNLGYGKSLFARIDDNFQNNVNSPVQMLCEQYRMKKEICEYPNKTYYGGKLKSFPIHVNKIIPELKPYLLFNINNAEQENNRSYTNTEEVQLVCKMLNTLQERIQSQCKYSIGIITPYRAQKDLLLRNISNIRFNPHVSVTVNTVDSFQGMENDVVIISCVRFTPNYFLQNEQRLNVALTRARQALYIVGHYTLFKHCRPLYDLREDAKRRKLCIDINQSIRNIRNLHSYLIKG